MQKGGKNTDFGFFPPFYRALSLFFLIRSVGEQFPAALGAEMLLFQIERFLIVVDAGVAVRAFILDEVYACIFVILVVLAVFVLVILLVVEVMMTAAMSILSSVTLS